MPQLQRPKPGLGIRLLTALLLLGLCYGGYAAFMAVPWVSAFVLVAVVASTMLTARNDRRALQALAAQCAGESICTFARSFEPRAVDTWVVRAVYEQLQAELADLCPQFPVRASDELQHKLLVDPDDLDMSLAPDIARRTGRSLDSTDGNPYWGKVHTVRDLVLFFNAQARSSAA